MHYLLFKTPVQYTKIDEAYSQSGQMDVSYLDLDAIVIRRQT